MVAAILWWPPCPALAGPPLIADDPNTVGPGVVQPIFAASMISQGNGTLVRGPTVDLTVGLVDTLDATAVVSLASWHDATVSPPWSLSGLFAVGVKWELLRTERGSLAFSPAFVGDSKIFGQPAGLLSVQGELRWAGGQTAIGFDVGYVPVRRSRDEWFAAVYVVAGATPRLNVLGEVWAISFGRAEAADLGVSLGIDFGIDRDRLRLLVDVGTGLVSFGGPRIDVRVYLGTQFTFGNRRDRWHERASTQ